MLNGLRVVRIRRSRKEWSIPMTDYFAVDTDQSFPAICGFMDVWQYRRSSTFRATRSMFSPTAESNPSTHVLG